MTTKEFCKIRKYLEKSQSQLARLLCISTKSVQSFEQGWRNIPVNVERQLLYILSIKWTKTRKVKPCWEIKKCPAEWKVRCSAWELKSGYTCWHINGTYCEGNEQIDWEDKLKICRHCEVFHAMIPEFVFKDVKKLEYQI